MKEVLLSVFGSTWPMILICTVIIVSLRLYYIIKNKVKIVLYNELIMLSFVLYIMCLFYVVTFPDNQAPWATSNFIPFREMFRYSFLSRLFIKNIIGNFFMFIPFGFYISYILKIHKLSVVILFNLLASVTIEIIQLIIGRVFDIDDIILNVLGGMFGFIIYLTFHFIKSSLPNAFSKPIVYNTLTIIGLSIFIYLASRILIF